MIIVGAGIAGLLAANLMGRHRPIIHEAQPALPHNHHSVLRFRSSVVGDALGIPFRKVRVVRATMPWRNPVADSLAYAEKCSGTLRSDRSLPQATEAVDRYIAPPDLVARMAERVEVVLDSSWDFSDRSEKVVSTIPMPTLANVVGHVWGPGIKFEWVSGFNVLADVAHCDAFVSLYVPDPRLEYARVSLTGRQLIVEAPNVLPPPRDDGERWAIEAAHLLGIKRPRLGDVRLVRQDYAKILPIDEGERRRFIYETSTVRQIAFSLGRFATWRPTLLADDLVKDVRIIENMATSSSLGYDAEKMERDRGHGPARYHPGQGDAP